MKRIFSLYILVNFALLPCLGFAQENTEKKEPASEQTEASKEEGRVKFSPTNRRDPFLSRDEISTIERNRRAEMERIEKERKAKEDALIAARDAEKAKAEREAYLKANPHLAIISKIKIQGMMGDEVQINNDFKGVGSKVAGATITKITGTRIYFKYKGKDFSLPIPKPKD
ncbi:MAG: hypothetical protein II972_05060 [Elusimicrobiaceae bacterium]|nr:hypothetical protein [Elusimicrobiaceae bacterium]